MTTVGVLAPLSGPFATTGAECRVAALHARDCVLRERGTAPRVAVADAPDPASAHRATRALVDEGAAVICGSVTTPLALAAIEATRAQGVLYVELAAAGHAVTGGASRGVLRLAARGDAYGREVIEFARGHPWSLASSRAVLRVGIVYGDTPFGVAVASGFELRAAEVGLAVAYSRAAATTEDALALAAELEHVDLDLLHLVHLGGRAASVWRRLREAGAPVRMLVGHAGWGYRRSIADARELAEGTFVAGAPSLGTFPLEALGPEARHAAASWLARCGDDPAAHSLDASIDRDQFFSGALVVVRALSSMSDAGPAAVERALRELDIPLGDTPIGSGVRFDERGENARAVVAVSQWRDGGRRTVWPASLTAEVPVP